MPRALNQVIHTELNVVWGAFLELVEMLAVISVSIYYERPPYQHLS